MSGFLECAVQPHLVCHPEQSARVLFPGTAQQKHELSGDQNRGLSGQLT